MYGRLYHQLDAALAAASPADRPRVQLAYVTALFAEFLNRVLVLEGVAAARLYDDETGKTVYDPRAEPEVILSELGAALRAVTTDAEEARARGVRAGVFRYDSYSVVLPRHVKCLTPDAWTDIGDSLVGEEEVA